MVLSTDATSTGITRHDSDCAPRVCLNEGCELLYFPLAYCCTWIGRHMFSPSGISHVCGCNYDVSMTKVGKLTDDDAILKEGLSAEKLRGNRGSKLEKCGSREFRILLVKFSCKTVS